MKKLAILCPKLGGFLFCGKEEFRVLTVHGDAGTPLRRVQFTAQGLVQMRPLGDGTDRTTRHVTGWSLS